jgi:hypothetical protein
MSRGAGYLQRYLFGLLNGKELTFAEIIRIAKPHEVTYMPHLVRSMRRSLRKMIDDQVVIALGRGGPGDPHRYAVHPMLAALMEIERRNSAEQSHTSSPR